MSGAHLASYKLPLDYKRALISLLNGRGVVVLSRFRPNQPPAVGQTLHHCTRPMKSIQLVPWASKDLPQSRDAVRLGVFQAQWGPHGMHELQDQDQAVLCQQAV